MPDPAARAADELRRAAAEAVTALPGVVRLEPTLSNALRRLQAAAVARTTSGRTAYSAVEGIRLVQHGDRVDIHVDVTLATTEPADVTARLVHDTLESTILSRGLLPGEVTVSVLRLRT